MDATITIRRLGPNDAQVLHDFYQRLSPTSRRTFAPFGQNPPLDKYEGVERDNDPETGDKYDLVAINNADGHIAGWGFVWGLQSNEPVFGLGVADEHHGQGVGGRLMDAVLAAMRTRGVPKVYLTVVTDNDRAWQMYGRRGFVRYGEFTGEDGLPYFRMVASLGS